jgi:hypothetical protein
MGGLSSASGFVTRRALLALRLRRRRVGAVRPRLRLAVSGRVVASSVSVAGGARTGGPWRASLAVRLLVMSGRRLAA